MPHFVKVERECDHEDCIFFYIDAEVEAGREICCEEDGDDCDPVVLPCSRTAAVHFDGHWPGMGYCNCVACK